MKRKFEVYFSKCQTAIRLLNALYAISDDAKCINAPMFRPSGFYMFEIDAAPEIWERVKSEIFPKLGITNK